jgi:tetratricopeptide (TPR) repeat protein
MRARLRRRPPAAASIWLALFAAVAPAQAEARQDVKVEAVLSATRVAAGDATVLQISIETKGEGADALAPLQLAPGLEVTGAQEFSQLQVAYPGGRSRLIRRDLIIRAHLPGDYVIPAIPITVGGTTYRTQALSLYVEPRRRGSGGSGAPTGDEVLLRAWVEPDTVYVGQQVLFRAEALFPRDLRQRQSRPATYEAPTPPDFWIQDLPDAVTTGLRSINGAVYETQTFRRAYFPLAPGTFSLPPARLVYEIRRGFLYAPEGRELVSDSMRLVVRPIPETGRPASWTGAVGRFTLSARLEPQVVAVGEAATLTVELNGNGNVKALPPPALGELKDVDVFPPSEESDVDAALDEIGGRKRFTWVLIPETPGRVELPPIEYAFFDPESDAFEVARSQPFSLRATPEAAARPSALADTALRPLADGPAPAGRRWVRSPWFAALQVVPLLALLGAVLVRRSGATPGARRARRQLRAARFEAFDSLRRAATSAESDPVFFGDFAAAIRSALADLLARPELRTAARDQLAEALRRRGLRAESVAAVDALFQRIDVARFAHTAATPAERAALVSDAKHLLDRVETELRATRHGAAAGVALALLTLAGSAAAQNAASGFDEGVRLFDQKRYDDAVSAFTDYVRGHDRDANAWYNLGNAYLRLDRRGYAVWAWSRALVIRPRDADARHNLRAVGAHEALAGLPPAFALSVDEAVLALTALWWLAGIGAAGLLLARKRGAILVAALAAGLAFVVTGPTLAGALRGARAISLGESTPLLADPTLRAEQLADLGDGAPVAILERRGDWWRVRRSDGREGWVEAALLAEV